MNKQLLQARTSITLNKQEAILAAKTSCGLMDIVGEHPEYRFQILLENSSSQEFVMPAEAMQLLIQMLTEMGQGNAVALTPIEEEITTQQAANILNVSRPYLVQLLEYGEIPFRKVGSHRRIKLKDVTTYKQHIDALRYGVLNELTAYDQEIGLQ